MVTRQESRQPARLSRVHEGVANGIEIRDGRAQGQGERDESRRAAVVDGGGECEVFVSVSGFLGMHSSGFGSV